ncbi:unnamed protein product [Symbiodinium sp. CCMP2592]|nr:unnamed protein product [Symbiodinium sp. CCMP2592]
MSDVHKYEQQQNETLAKRRKTGAHVPQQGAEHSLNDHVVQVTDQQSLELRTCLGILWPENVYESKFGQKPNPKQITKIKQGGTSLTGVLLPRSEGLEPGCTEVFDVKQSAATNVVTTADANTAINAKEMTGAWERARDMHNFATRTKAETENSPEVHTLAQAGKRKRVDEFDDLMEFDYGMLSIEGAGDDDDGKAGGKGRGRKGRGSNGGGKPRPKPKPAPAPGGDNAPNPSPEKPANKSEAKVAKEVQASERVLLEGKQILENLQCSDRLQMVKTKALQTVADKVKNRLTPSLVGVYTLNYDPTASSSANAASPGMRVLEELRALQTSLASVTALVTALNDEKSTGRDIWEAAKAAGDYKIPAKLMEMALSRDIDSAARTSDVDKLKVLLGANAGGGAGEGFNASLIEGDAVRLAFLDREVIRLIAELLREDNKAAAVKSLLEAILKEGLLPDESSIKGELTKLQPLLDPMNQDVLALDDLKALLQDFRCNKDLKLHKCLNNFSTGLQILEAASLAYDRRVKDVALESRLTELRTKVSEEPDFKADEYLEQLLAFCSKYEKAADEMADIRRTASTEFIARAVDKLGFVDKKIQAYAQAVCKRGEESACDRLSKACQFLLEVSEGQIAGGELEQKVIVMERMCRELSQEIEEKSDLTLAKVLDVESLKKPRAELEIYNNVARILRSNCRALLVGCPLDCADIPEHQQALVELLGQPPQQVESVQGFAAFKETAISKFHFMVETALVETLKPVTKVGFVKTIVRSLLLCEPDVAIDPSALEADISTKEMSEAGDKTLALLKSMAAWKDRNFGGLAAAILADSDGNTFNVPLWLVCYLPAFCKSITEVKAIARKKDSIISPDAERDEEDIYEEFATAILKAKTAADDVLCSLRGFEEPDSQQGMKMMVMQKFESGTVKAMKQLASGLCSSLLAETTRAQQQIDTLLAKQELSSVRSSLQQGCDQVTLNSLLPIAQSADTKQLHQEVKGQVVGIRDGIHQSFDSAERVDPGRHFVARHRRSQVHVGSHPDLRAGCCAGANPPAPQGRDTWPSCEACSIDDRVEEYQRREESGPAAQ